MPRIFGIPNVFPFALSILNRLTVTVANAAALAVGANGATNPAFAVDSAAANAATGLKVTAAAAAGRVALAAISSGTDEGLDVDAKGAGTVRLGANSTGAVTVPRRFEKTQGADVGSAGDLVLGGDGNAFEVTGTTTINAVTTTGWQNGSVVHFLFTASVTVKHNTAGGAGTAVMLLSGAADFSATAGDTLTLLLAEIGGVQAWRELSRTVI